MAEDDHGPLLDHARRAAILNARRLGSRAIDLFDREDWPTACFYAMTAIEEVGKAVIVGFGRHLAAMREMEVPFIENDKPLQAVLRDHPGKAVEAATWTLRINAGADRRHGVHPESGMHRTSGVVLLARSGRWMTLRNACLYVDVDISSETVTQPSEQIGRAHAYYFICMALEVLAEAAEFGLAPPVFPGDCSEAHSFTSECLRELDEFVSRARTDVDELSFLSEPIPLEIEADLRKARRR